jgi:antibiotic biosynthesis monooxygenase (ABM) superfamily enzyme
MTTPRPPALDGAPVLYFVQAWVRPEGGERYLAWLERTHMASVLREPGFLWARRVALEQRDAQGWPGYLLVYALSSREMLERYLHSPARDAFWRELEAFADVHRAERFWGSVDFAPASPHE